VVVKNQTAVVEALEFRNTWLSEIKHLPSEIGKVDDDNAVVTIVLRQIVDCVTGVASVESLVGSHGWVRDENVRKAREAKLSSTDSPD